MQRWQNKIRKLRQFLRGWVANMGGAYKKEEQELLRKADELDEMEENLLNKQELDLKQCIKDRLAQLSREEEIKWFQRAKTKELLEGDCNTKYFQLVANEKRRKTRIYKLEQEEGVIDGEENQFCVNNMLGRLHTAFVCWLQTFD